MSLKLIRRPGRPHWYIHGTVRGITIRESTGVADQKAAEAIRAQREWEIIQRSVFGAEATATFVGAAVSYLEAGGERTYLKPIIARIGSMPLAKIDQAFIEKTARALYPNALPATLNRQAFTPIAAVLNHAAKRGLCARKTIERPPQPKGRVRWITFEEAERLLAACSTEDVDHCRAEKSRTVRFIASSIWSQLRDAENHFPQARILFSQNRFFGAQFSRLQRAPRPVALADFGGYPPDISLVVESHGRRLSVRHPVRHGLGHLRASANAAGGRAADERVGCFAGPRSESTAQPFAALRS